MGIQTNSKWQAKEGAIFPLGANWIEEEKAWNFVLVSKYASDVQLLLYSHNEYKTPAYSFKFDPLVNKSGPLWHCRIPQESIPNAYYYAYRVSGPLYQDGGFYCFDPQKVLLDPYARSVFFPPEFSREAACKPSANDGQAPLGVLMKEDNFDWQGTTTCNNDQLIIYEMHVRGFTKHESSNLPENERGTFKGVISKIPYLKELGITAVELMPIFQFDPQEKNYWGYMPINFFSPHTCYSCSDSGEEQRHEFKEMVREFHLAGIEVILDVVYNHTGEGGLNQPNYSFKGIDNCQYYLRSDNPNDPYANFTGCGNTLNSNEVCVQSLIVDSLKYWREEMHIDGFRFDLASIFTRSSNGDINKTRPPIFAHIRSADNLSKARLIAEPWDAAGAFHLGRAFPGWLWMQWNAHFRDTIQRFIRGDSGILSDLMTRLYGSCDLFPDDTFNACHPWQSLNYVSSHDGSTLYDLVSFEKKNNWANGENNKDGSEEAKWNCGWEGNENVPDEIKILRKQQVKNIFTLLLVSNGTPMFKMGDEFLNTQNGNNNPYNQDNETNWLNWNLLEDNKDLFNFVKKLIKFRKETPTICRSRFWREDVKWYGTVQSPDFSNHSRCLAFYLNGKSENSLDLYVMINGDDTRQTFNIQNQNDKDWKVLVDTSQPSGKDFLDKPETLPNKYNFSVASRSIVILIRENN